MKNLTFMSKSNINKGNYPHGMQKEVSKKTGLSVKTVNVFFNNGVCSLDTQLKIKQAIKEIEAEL